MMKSWLNLESVVESRTLSPVVVMAISEHRPMLTAITRYVHTKKRTNSTSITSSSHQGQALHRRVLCAVRLCMETREKSWVSAFARKNPRGRQVVLDSVKEYLCGDVADELDRIRNLFSLMITSEMATANKMKL